MTSKSKQEVKVLSASHGKIEFFGKGRKPRTQAGRVGIEKRQQKIT